MISSFFSTKVHLSIDIQPCLADGLHECFDSAKSAAEFIAAAIQNNWASTLPIVDVESMLLLYVLLVPYYKII